MARADDDRVIFFSWHVLFRVIDLHGEGVSTSMTASQPTLSLTLDNMSGEEIQCQLLAMTLGHINV